MSRICYPSPRFASQRMHALRGGFALIIAITLMAFIFLLLVSLVTMSQMEARSAQQKFLEHTARLNARFALNVAIGNLQKYTGPDQRVTARAEILDTATTPPHAGNAQWTGVWHSAPDPAAATPFERGEEPQWLISASNPPDPTVATLNASGAPTNGDYALLVGSGSTNLNAATGGNPNNAIAAEKIDLTTANNDVTGRYAWWVGDEGVKASMVLVDPYDPAANVKLVTPTALEELRRLAVAQRFGWEALSPYESYPLNDPSLRRLSTLGEFVLLPMVTDIQQAKIDLRNSFHDLTTLSQGVLSDVRDGGLKKDLSRGLESGASLPSGNIPDTQISWDRLRDYYALAGQTSLTPRVGDSPIVPIMVGGEEWIGLYFEEVPLPSGADPLDGPFYDLYLAYTAKLVLWNPYSVPLAPARYTFQSDYLSAGAVEVGVGNLSGPANLPGGNRTEWRDGGQYLNASNQPIFGSPGRPSNGSALWEYDWIRFRTTTAVGFDAGEVKQFSVVPSSGDYVQRYTGFQATPMDTLVEGFPGVGFITLRHPHVKFQNIPRSDIVDGRWRINAESNTNSVTATQRGRLFRDPSGESALNRSIAVYPRHGRVALRLEGDLISQYARPTYSTRSREALEDYLDSEVVIGYHNNRFTTGLAGGMTENRLQDVLQAEAPMPELTGGTDDDNNQLYAYETSPMIRSNIRGTDDAWIRRPRNDIDNNANHFTRTAPWGNTFGTDESFIDLSGSESFFNLQHDTSGISWWGSSRRGGSELGNSHIIMFDIPQEKPYSIGALRHAHLTNERYQPTYIIGNSKVDTYVGRRESEDLVYRVNEAIWDGYFFSSVPSGLASLPSRAEPLSNSRMSLLSKADPVQQLVDLQNYDNAAANLLVEGAFNVNSTSVDAWTAYLASTLGVVEHTGLPSENLVAVPRVQPRDLSESTWAQVPTGGYQPYYMGEGAFDVNIAAGGGGNTVNSSTSHPTHPRIKLWNGNRVLRLDDVRRLAEQVVEQVKLRGPFLSVAQFVNREPQQTKQRRMAGALQAAIDNVRYDATASRPDPSIHPSEFQPIVDFYRGMNRDSVANDYRMGNADGQQHAGSTALVTIDGEDYVYPLSADAPGFLAQHDLLSLLAPTIAVRSDTFKVRAYGETTNPITGESQAKAWIEATIQRMPDTLDSNDDLLNPDTNTYPFGRRFIIHNFRWLNENEI